MFKIRVFYITTLFIWCDGLRVNILLTGENTYMTESFH
jgi:hypothetical protein